MKLKPLNFARKLSEPEAAKAGQRLSAAMHFLTMARMVLGTAELLTRETKAKFNALWRQTKICEEVMFGITIEDDEELHELCAECADLCQQHILKHYAAKAAQEAELQRAIHDSLPILPQ